MAARICFVWAMVMGTVFSAAPARAEFQVPALTGPVVDQAGILDSQTERLLENALRALHEKGGSQINVLTVSSLEGLPIESASIKVVDEWKLGGRKTDNGALLLVAPKDRSIRIEVGQGLEGVLTDAQSKRIIEDSILPLFRSGDYASGVLVGVHQVARLTDPDFDLTPYLEGRERVSRRTRETSGSTEIPGRLIFFILILIILSLFSGGRGGRGLRRRGGVFYGGWGGGGGSWGSGGGSGGGWSGGGGGFSGGGASGNW